MKNLKNNLTFAVIVKDVAWRTDLTIRFCEYFSNKINDDFLDKVTYPDTIDEAIEKCETDYLLVQTSGHIVYEMDFFKSLDALAELNEDIAVGFIEVAEDYLILNEKCLFVNIPLWKEAGRPKYKSGVHEGDRFKIGEYKNDNRRPFEVFIEPNDRTFVPNEASELGAELIIRQLEKNGNAKSLLKFSQNNETHYLDVSTPYYEIRTDTIFEKTFLTNTRKKVFTNDTDKVYPLETTAAEILIVPANGLKAYTLAEHYKVKEVVIYDMNPLALEFQKRIFSIDAPYLYGDIVRQFIKDFPEAIIADDWSNDEFSVVKKMNLKVRYEVVDAFSFEMENLIFDIDRSIPAIFDLSDIFVYPYNYYRRPLFLVEGLFAQLYSHMKSRTGPTFIFGAAPGYQSLDAIEINTSRKQFEMDPTIDPYAIDESIPEEERVPIVVEPIMYAPDTCAPRIPEREDKKSWFKSLKNAITAPQTIIKEVIREVYIDRMIEVPAATIQVKPVPIIDVNAPIEVSIPIEKLAAKFGYSLMKKETMIGGVNKSATVLLKNVAFEEFEAVFEYSVDEDGGAWSFKVGKNGVEKQIEFSNGMSYDGFLKHFREEVKINPKTAVRYFK
jgi:hypothetical protein